MPARNVYIALVVVFVSLFIAFKTSVKDQILRGVASQLQREALYVAPPERLLEGALAGMTDAVGDPYTAYIPSEEKQDYMREIQGQFAGVGIGHFIKDGETGEFYFVPLRGAPAAEAGLKFGDRIVEVDGESVKKASLFDLSNAIRGEEKTTVKLTIRPRASNAAFSDAASTPASDADLREVELTRAVVQENLVSGDRLDENGDWIYTLKDYPEIGYVAIEQFADATTPQTLTALDSLEKAGVSSVILDFRGNPGGFLPDAVAICDEFVKAGAPIVEVRDRDGDVKRLFRGSDRPKKAFRVVVLVDGDAASASEIVAAALQDSGIAAVGGARSYGKGTIQSLFELPFNFGMLRVTTAQFFRPSGKPIRRVEGDDVWGVTPDAALAVELTEPQRFYRRLLRAVRVSGAETGVADPRIFAFATAETDALLRRAAQTGDAFARLEALTELGLDPQDAARLFDRSETPDAAESSDVAPQPDAVENAIESSKTENANKPTQTAQVADALPSTFEPVGRAPYFDPQLDRAVDYLRGTLDADATDAPSLKTEANANETAEKSEANATPDVAE